MSVEINQMAAPVELHEHREETEDDGPPYNCAYCRQERGYDFMEEMCADCYWDYDSLRKQPRRILNRMLLAENAERQEEMQGWFDDAKQQLADFEERLAAGQDYLYPEHEETVPKPLEELTVSELHSMLDSLDEGRKEYRGKTMTPADTELYESMNRSAQAVVDELAKRGQ